jgi:hypothetical protein
METQANAPGYRWKKNQPKHTIILAYPNPSTWQYTHVPREPALASGYNQRDLLQAAIEGIKGGCGSSMKGLLSSLSATITTLHATFFAPVMPSS